MRFTPLLAGSLALLASPALAQEEPAPPRAETTSATDETAPPPPFKLSGGVTVVSDYRFRGLTQSDETVALQGTVNLNHESGFYVGTWASTIDGDGSTPALTGYGGAEFDLYAGYTKTFTSGVGVDVGLLYYYYPGGASGLDTDFFEPYASLTYTIGPVAAKLGAAYAWGGQDGLDFTGGKDDNIYAFLDASIGVPSTPITLKGHAGYSNGSLGLANPLASDDDYWDWSVTAEFVTGPFKAGVSYVDTDVTNRTVAGVGRFADTLGRDATVLGYIGFSF